jgi:hypothetical protein
LLVVALTVGKCVGSDLLLLLELLVDFDDLLDAVGG